MTKNRHEVTHKETQQLQTDTQLPKRDIKQVQIDTYLSPKDRKKNKRDIV